MTTAALLVLLGFGTSFAAAPKADPAATKLVEYFLKTETAELPPEQVPEFIAVDPQKLPAKLRDRFEAKRLELLALKKNADGKYKPPLRMLGKEGMGENCGPPRDMAAVSLLVQTGFEEISQEEEEWLMHETRCSECELRTEFSLTLVATPPKKKDAKKELHYLLHGMDPIMTLVAKFRAGDASHSTAFFGIATGPKCR